MPADERIKVTFKSVFLRRDSDLIGQGEICFHASVAGQAVGNPDRVFNASDNTWIRLPEAQWSTILDVRNRRDVQVVFRGREEDVISDDDLGTVRHTLRFPFRQEHFVFRHSTPFYALEWEVELSVGGRFGRHAPNQVFATRQNTGSVTCTTVSGSSFRARMEIHPVRPCPQPPPNTRLPRRPAFPAGTVPFRNEGNSNITSTAPMNVIPNPPVIPILGPPAAAPVGPHRPEDLDYANWANDRNCARLEATWYVPNTLAFTDNDSRLEWHVISTGGGAVSFFGPARGRRVMCYGTSAGAVRIEVRFQGAIFAVYRAIVMQVKQVPCRYNIHNGTTADSTPRATPDDVHDHHQIANRFLRQVGLQLTLDTDPTRTNGATATTRPGIFRIRVARGRTRNVANTDRCTVLNFRNNVMNFAYIHSDNAGNLGAATDFPNSGAPSPPTSGHTNAARMSDSGTPSSSWVRPTGVGIGADATTGTVQLHLIGARQRTNAAGNLTHPNLFAMYVTDDNGGPAGSNHRTQARQMTYAGTIAHEFGHILNLGHRVEGIESPPGSGTFRDINAADAPGNMAAGGIFWDGMLHPPGENVMHWRNGTNLAQDFDILQARAVHLSPLVTGAPSLPPAAAPPTPPRGHPTGSRDYTIVSGDWLDAIARRHGMSGWRDLWNYDGGTGIPNRDRLRSGDPDVIYPGEVILVPSNGATA